MVECRTLNWALFNYGTIYTFWLYFTVAELDWWFPSNLLTSGKIQTGPKVATQMIRLTGASSLTQRIYFFQRCLPFLQPIENFTKIIQNWIHIFFSFHSFSNSLDKLLLWIHSTSSLTVWHLIFHRLWKMTGNLIRWWDRIIWHEFNPMIPWEPHFKCSNAVPYCHLTYGQNSLADKIKSCLTTPVVVKNILCWSSAFSAWDY